MSHTKQVSIWVGDRVQPLHPAFCGREPVCLASRIVGLAQRRLPGIHKIQRGRKKSASPGARRKILPTSIPREISPLWVCWSPTRCQLRCCIGKFACHQRCCKLLRWCSFKRDLCKYPKRTKARSYEGSVPDEHGGQRETEVLDYTALRFMRSLIENSPRRYWCGCAGRGSGRLGT